jgi:D-methionine transport system substrate-binding protein
MKKLLSLILVTFSFQLVNAQFSSAAENTKEKAIGTTIGDFADIVKESLGPALEKRGYKIRLVEFSDYVQPNIALSEGSLDMNIFQHKPYLEDFAKQKGLALKPLAQVPTAPLAIYAGKKKSLAEVKNGDSVALPNDPTNLARALFILQDLKWIELPKNINAFTVAPKDIKTNFKNIKIVQLEAAQIPRSLQDVDYAIINGNYVVSSGLQLTAALQQEKSDAYVNWAVIRAKDENSKFANDVKEILNSKEFQAYSKKKFKGYRYPTSWK